MIAIDFAKAEATRKALKPQFMQHASVTVCANINADSAPAFNRAELAHINYASPLREFGLEADVYGVNSLGMVISVVWSKKQKCTHCDSDGYTECSACGHDSECDECNGSSLSHNSEALVTRCDGRTIIKIFDHLFTKNMLGSGLIPSNDLIVHQDAWEMV